MWQTSFRVGVERYPQRHGESDCAYYLRTGYCKFGMACRFNHPPDRKLNAKDCEYYLTTGRCKFHEICKYNHPEPSNSMSFVLSPSTSGQQSYPGGSFIASPHCQDPSSYAQQSNPQGMVRLPSWNTFPTFDFDLSQQQKSGIGKFAGTSHQSIRAMGSSASFSSQFGSSPKGKSSLQRGSIFPVRHGEPDCPFFIKTGDCKFGAMCRFHHPIERLIRSPDCMLNPNGFPLRPGKPQCVFYSRYGTCKYGPTCKFDHPIAAPKGTLTANPSTSSSSDVPVVGRVLRSLSQPPPALSLVSESSAMAGPSTSRRLPSSNSCK